MKVFYAALATAGAAMLGAVLVTLYAYLVVVPNLPALDALADYQPKMPMRVYTADNVLIGEFGEEHRDFVPIREMPDLMKKAVIAIEDDHFYEHHGVYYPGVLRAALANLRSSRSQGASTITMQVARAFFLSRKKTYARKLSEIMLAFRIEEKFSKDQILELYMNQIYLGERAYGFGTAARIYFGKPVQNLSIAEAAMLAGLPQSPAAANPVVNPARARQRQMQVLKRMRDLGYISPVQYDKAAAEKLNVLGYRLRYATHAEYAAEQVRQLMYNIYKDDIYTRGFNVYTTLRKADQDAAYEALRRGVLDYDRRHGYRGPEDFIDLPKAADDRRDAIEDILLKHPDSDDLLAAVVTSASPKLVRAELLSGEVVEVSGDGLRFAANALSSKARNAERIRPGTVIRVARDARKKWTISQLPEVQAAFVSLDALDGNIRAFVGGFDFNQSKLDHVTQAWRQPGSSIKPFVYSAALEKGFAPGTVINDAPISIDAGNGQAWEPQNDDGKYDGPVTMRTGLKRSKNMVSIRILQTITPAYAREYLGRFGFDTERHPSNLTLTLGTGAATPVQMAAAYAVFANGGNRVLPALIRKVTDARGNILQEIKVEEPGRVIDPRNAFIMDSMMRDVARSGTAAMATQRLGRNDLAGKTGTTNDAIDGWFAGYGGDVVGVAWMGYDKPRSMGGREYGGTVALPIWIDYMRVALRGRPEVQRIPPAGVVQVDGDWMYQEFVGTSVVRPPEQEDNRSWWEKIFGGGPSAPAPVVPAAPGGPVPARPAPAPVAPATGDMSYRN
ncbi:penicillin-binding protein 1A [Noviherbaspirillum galbum]|uniref:Penicillin-binding protein 1A n=1 Tax=Noviherbaspirillum galbum TaxID=2709383 RepID=A0A6B3SIM9_9BURK|nr:penicillin-binding protein 1A [Noviherbaspirillum galbum]NEX60530.1 penicillin-binding protein 1A [Noviherbaspirillum galbum]